MKRKFKIVILEIILALIITKSLIHFEVYPYNFYPTFIALILISSLIQYILLKKIKSVIFKLLFFLVYDILVITTLLYTAFDSYL